VDPRDVAAQAMMDFLDASEAALYSAISMAELAAARRSWAASGSWPRN
jgi:hypothetical protein